MTLKCDAWTYFVQSVDGGPIKIGFTSRTPEERLSALQVGSPTKLRIVGLLPMDREKELHQRFDKHKSHGEWFNPAKDLLEFIHEEASSHLQERLATNARLQLEAITVPVLQASPQRVSASSFDCVFPNDENLLDALLEYCDWDEGDAWDGEGEPDEADLPSNAIASMAMICEESGSFVESVGVNEDAGLVGFICGPCNSKRRFEILRSLGVCAEEIDSHTAKWFFFAIFWDGGRQVGIDLLQLAIWGGENNSHIFDPAKFVCHGIAKSNQLVRGF